MAVAGHAIPWRQVEPGIHGVDGPGRVVHVREPVEAVRAEVGVDIVNVETPLAPSEI